MTTRNLYFIDSAVTDYQSLLSQLPAESEWYLLDKSRDGIGQIADIVSRYHDLDAIQIISHGSPGTLYLGSSVVNNANLADYNNQLAAIGASLTATGDIFLYGCDVAAGDAGQRFVNDLAVITGADVAAKIGRAHV